MATLGQVIKAHRKKKGLSIDDLSKALGVNRSTLYRYETSEIGKIPALILAKLASFLNVPMESLLEEVEEAGSPSRQSTAESALLYRFRILNEDGQNRVLEFAADIVRIDDYRLASMESNKSAMSSEDLDYLIADIEEMTFWKEDEQ